MYTKGQIVYSKCGRDRANPFIIIKEEAEFLYLVDGKLRKLSSPKKKNKKHVQIVNEIDNNIKKKLDENLYLLDSDVRKALQPYKINCNSI